MAEITTIQPSQTAVPVRCGAYCRVSTASEEQMHSIAAQRLAFLSGGCLVEVYSDVASGTNAHRPGLLRLIADCRSGRVNRVVTKSISRFARNTRDCLAILRELSALGVTVLFEKENIDTARSADEMMIAVMGGLAQEESGSISRNVRWSLRRKMAAGTLGVARVPYGLRKGPGGGLEPDELTAENVRRMFSLYLDGMGLRRIAGRFNSEGLPSPSGGLWSAATVRKMLRQEKYAGDILWQKTFSAFMSPSRPNHGQADSFLVRGSHLPLITPEVFTETQRLLARNSVTMQNKNFTPFRGRLKCRLCGRAFYFVAAPRPYWQCSGRFDLARPCSNPIVHDDELNGAWERLRRKLDGCAGEIFDPCIALLRRLEQTRARRELDSINRRIDELRERRLLISRMFVQGRAGRGELMTAENELNRELAALDNWTERWPGDIKEMISALERLRKGVSLDELTFARIAYGSVTFTLSGGLAFTEKLPDLRPLLHGRRLPEPLRTIGTLALCGGCGGRLSRRRIEGEYFWKCGCGRCGNREMRLTDEQLVGRVTSVIGRVMDSHRLIQNGGEPVQFRMSPRVRAMGGEIGMLIDTGDIGAEALVNIVRSFAEELFGCVVYSDVPERTAAIERALNEGGELDELVMKTVRRIYVAPERVRVKFINGKTVRSERSVNND